MICELTARKFCRDDISLIENYAEAMADTEHTWEIHHRLELTMDGEFAIDTKDLKRLGMYYGRPYFELVFLSKSAHQKLHGKSGCPQVKDFIKRGNAATRGKIWTEEQRNRIRGRIPWNRGLSTPESTRIKQAMAKQGKHWKLVDGRRVWYN